MEGCLHALAPGRAATPVRQRSLFPPFLLKWSFNGRAAFKRAFRPTWCDKGKLKDGQTGSHVGRDDPKRRNQIKIIQFIQTCLTQSKSARPKAATLYVYNMSLFLVACLLQQMTTSQQGKVPTKEDQRLDHHTFSQPSAWRCCHVEADTLSFACVPLAAGAILLHSKVSN